MSQEERKKQVIHVKDLIIQAEQVHIEQVRPKREPLFGRPYPNQHTSNFEEAEETEEIEAYDSKKEESEELEAESEEPVAEKEQEAESEEPVAEKEQEAEAEETKAPLKRRKGFSWI